MRNPVYSKVRNRVVVEFIIQSILLGLAAAGIGFAAILIIAKLIPAELHWGIYLGTSLGCFVLVIAFMLLFKLPTEKRICQRADKEFGLKEQMLTANEFKNEENDEMIKIQRETAYKNLSEHKKSKLSLKFSLLPLLLCMVGGCSVAVSTVVPYRQITETVIEEESSSEIGADNASLIEKVDEIIDDITKDQEADSNTKQDINDILEDLKEDLENSEQNPEDAVQDAIDSLDELEKDATTYEKVGEAMEEKDILGELGEAIKEGDEEKIQDALDDLLEDLDNMDDEEFKEAVDEIIKELEEVLDELEEEGVDATGVQIDLEELKNDLEEAKKNEDVQTERQDVDKALSEGIGSVKETIEQEQANKDAIEEAKEDLEDMLENMQGEKPESSQKPDKKPDSMPQGSSGNMPPESGNPNGSARPGTSSGALVFADDEQIYDPETNTYVTYGDVLNYYYALLNGEISETDIPEDVLKVLYEYFSYLFYEDEKGSEGGQVTPPTSENNQNGDNTQGE